MERIKKIYVLRVGTQYINILDKFKNIRFTLVDDIDDAVYFNNTDAIKTWDKKTKTSISRICY